MTDLPLGVVGAGSFGTAMANVAAENHHVFLYTRREENYKEMSHERMNGGRTLRDNITPTMSLEEIANKCRLILITVPSDAFRIVMRQLGPLLGTGHIIIHGTKGLDIDLEEGVDTKEIRIENIRRMSQVVREESNVMRIGALAGPNLAGEIEDGQPAGAVIASRFNDVRIEGRKYLTGKRFKVYESHDLAGAEMAGVLKNCLAIAAGALEGLGYGFNSRALLVSKGLAEIIRIGVLFGSDKSGFLGLPGIGDLIATCSSPNSRNFSFGYRLAQGDSVQEVLESMHEPAEGYRTVKLVKFLGDNHQVRVPIVNALYNVLYENAPTKETLESLLNYPYVPDIDFI